VILGTIDLEQGSLSGDLQKSPVCAALIAITRNHL